VRNVLILTYYWPPSGGSGVQRWLKFAKYLPQYGYRPIIITPRHGTAPYYDTGLLQDVPPEAEVIFTNTLEPFALYNKLQGKKKDAPVPVGMIGLTEKKSLFHRFAAYLRANLFVPDGRVGWVPYAQKAALKRIAFGDIDIIITTGPPHSTHLAGLAIAKKTGIPWIADLRDPWTTIYYNETLPRTKKTQAKDLALERKVLASASAILVTSPGLAEELAPYAKKINLLYNGYDADDLPTTRPLPYPSFTLAHVGNYFPSMEAPGLVDALVQLCKEIPSFAADFKLRFTGLLDPAVEAHLRQAGLGANMVVQSPVPHALAVEEMSKASVLLIVLSALTKAKGNVPGKIFEYLATGLPILAIGDSDSGAAAVLEQAGRPSLLPHADGVRIYEMLKYMYETWVANNKQPKIINSIDYQVFSRKSLAAQLAKIVDENCTT